MFRHRLLSSVIGIPIILGMLFWSEYAFGFLLIFIFLACSYELITIFVKPLRARSNRSSLNFSVAVNFLLIIPVGFFYLGMGFGHLWLVRSFSVWWAFLVITATWIYDTAAYGFGVWLGKHKMAPKISPGKTWEGTIGGIVSTVLYLGLMSCFGWLSLPFSMVLGLVVGIGATLGDLIESRFKRYANIKDTGTIIPGHGGFLDRFDSLILVSLLSFWFLTLVVKR